MNYSSPKYPALEKAVLQTLAYGDIFDYPLTSFEIWKYIIYTTSVDHAVILRILDSLLSKRIIGFSNTFYFLSQRDTIIRTRHKREEASNKKMKIVSFVCSFLSFIPTVRFVGVTGSLAMKNTGEEEDIDLFIITGRNRMWFTRFAVLIILQMLGRRRIRNGKDNRNKICVNMFMDGRNLEIPKHQQDLYSAHEVIQMIPVLNRDKTYEKFLFANLWVKQFLPNSISSHSGKRQRIQNLESLDSGQARMTNDTPVGVLEYMAKRLQLWYMQSHRTRETISDTLLAFHPVDYRKQILNEYNKKIRKYVSIS